MNATKLFVVTLFTAVASSAFAGEVSGTLQRAQVKADVVSAMKDGSLIRTGEGASTPCGQYVEPVGSAPALTRAEVQTQVAVARTQGTLLPAGAALYGSRAMYDTPRSSLPRADVKAQVMQARVDGTLIPAGEGYGFASRSLGASPVTLSQAR